MKSNKVDEEKLLPNVSILTVDIVKSTRLFKNLDIEEVKEFLDVFFQLVTRSVVEHNGNVIELTGDGLIAAFSCKDHILLACAAATHIIKMIKSNKLKFNIRIGIHADNINRVDHLSLLSSKIIIYSDKLQELAPENGIAISEVLVRECAQYLIVKEKKNIETTSDMPNLVIYHLLGISQSAEEALKKIRRSKKYNKKGFDQEKSIIGERKVATSLFIFYSKDMSKKIIKIVKQFSGTVIKYDVNTLFAVFGAPVAYEDHALRACIVASKIREELLNSKSLLGFKIGLNTGEVVSDYFGSKDFTQYDLLGISINVAARMMSMANNQAVQLTSITWNLVKPFIVYEDIGEKQVRGVDAPLRCYLLKGILESKIRKKMDQKLYEKTKFINHDSEINIFKNEMSETMHCYSNKTIALNAEAGYGKTRLAYEFARIALEQNHQVYSLSSSAYEVEIALATLTTLMRVIFNLNVSDLDRASQKSLISELLKLKLSQKQAVNALVTLAHGKVSDSSWLELSPTIQLKIIYQSLWEIILHLSLEKTIILIFEDLHWCDKESLGFIEYIIENNNNNKILIILDYRPEFRLSNKIKPKTIEIVIEPLSIEDSKKMLESMLPGDSKQLKQLHNKILEITSGVPLFIEEYLSVIIQKEYVLLKGDHYIVNKDISLNTLPSTIHETLSSRIDQLSLPEKRLLQKASILGRVFQVKLLRYMFDLTDEEFVQRLVNLEKSNFIFETAIIPEQEFTFKHALVQQSVYHSILKKNRRRYHSHLVLKIEKHEKKNLASFYSILAQHSFWGENWAKAIKYSHMEIPSGFNLSYPPSRVMSVVNNVKICFKHLNRADKELYFESYAYVVLSGTYALWVTNQVEESLNQAVELNNLAKDFKHDFFDIATQSWVVILNSTIGNANKVYELGKSIVSRLNETNKYSHLDTRDLRIVAYFSALHSASPIGKYKYFDTLVSQIFNESTDLLLTSKLFLYPYIAITHIHNGWSLSMRACFNKLESHMSNIEKTVSKIPHSEAYTTLNISLCFYYYATKDFYTSEKQVIKTIETALEINHVIGVSVVMPYYASLLYYKGDKDQALIKAQESVKYYELVNYTFASYTAQMTIDVLARCGDIKLAKSVLTHIKKSSISGEEIPLQAQCDRLEALLLNLTNKTDSKDKKIIKLLEKSFKLTNDTGCFLQNPLIYITYTEYYLRLGNLIEAKKYYHKALDYFAEYKMDPWYDYYSCKTDALKYQPFLILK